MKNNFFGSKPIPFSLKCSDLIENMLVKLRLCDILQVYIFSQVGNKTKYSLLHWVKSQFYFPKKYLIDYG